eukprot:3789332-Amphidinium_carterae.1
MGRVARRVLIPTALLLSTSVDSADDRTKTAQGKSRPLVVLLDHFCQRDGGSTISEAPHPH